MYASIRGIIQYKGKDQAVLEAGGVGYEILVGVRTLSDLPAVGQEAMLYTYLQVREDAMTLFGFGTVEEKAMFLKLIAISGVGPKVAMSVLSAMTVNDLSVAIVTEDLKALTRVPGLGKRTAERLVVDVRETGEGQDLRPKGGGAAAPLSSNNAQEAITALMALGYSSAEANRALAGQDAQQPVEALIVGALRTLDRG